jgi:hypothetical protein
LVFSILSSLLFHSFRYFATHNFRNKESELPLLLYHHYTTPYNNVNCIFLDVTSHYLQKAKRKEPFGRVLSRMRAVHVKTEDSSEVAIGSILPRFWQFPYPLHAKATLWLFAEVIHLPPLVMNMNHLPCHLSSIGSNHMIAVRVKVE